VSEEHTNYTIRQQALIESIAHGEVHYGTQFGGFYFHSVLRFEFAAEDQAFLKVLFDNEMIMHKPFAALEFKVQLREHPET
jgi:hypothetical protein